NWKKAAQRLGRLYRTVANQWANTLHRSASRLATTQSVVVIEDLQVSGLLKHAISRKPSAMWAGGIPAPPGLPGPVVWRVCHCGGPLVGVREDLLPPPGVGESLTLADRTIVCRHPDRPDGGWVGEDHDLNAATNRAQLAGCSADSQNACAGGSAGG